MESGKNENPNPNVEELTRYEFPYPCIGMFRFLNMNSPSSPYYPEIIQRLKNGEKLLDLGCCFGQELRQMVFDGAPAENLYGSDLRMDFMELGYDLFLDKDKLTSQFIAADVFDPESDLKQLEGKIDIIQSSSFFHLFTWDQQVELGKIVVKLLKPQPGSMIFGRQVGNKTPAEYPRRQGEGTRYRHDAASWNKLWMQIGEETGTKWHVEAELQPPNLLMVTEFKDLHPEGTGLLKSTVRRE